MKNSMSDIPLTLIEIGKLKSDCDDEISRLHPLWKLSKFAFLACIVIKMGIMLGMMYSIVNGDTITILSNVFFIAIAASIVPGYLFVHFTGSINECARNKSLLDTPKKTTDFCQIMPG